MLDFSSNTLDFHVYTSDFSLKMVVSIELAIRFAGCDRGIYHGKRPLNLAKECMPRHLCSNKCLFEIYSPKTCNFITLIIVLNIYFIFPNNCNVDIYDIIYTSNCLDSVVSKHCFRDELIYCPSHILHFIIFIVALNIDFM